MADEDLNDTLPPEPTATLPPPPALPTGIGDEPYARVFASMSNRVLHIHEDVTELRRQFGQLNVNVGNIETALGNIATALADITAELASHRLVTEELSSRLDALPLPMASGHA
jgi:hypothetical protein